MIMNKKSFNMEAQNNKMLNARKKWLVRFIIGAILLFIICLSSYYVAYDYAKEYYFNQLEELIVDRYLEGNASIGIYSYNTDKGTTLNYPGKYTDDWNLYLNYPNTYRPMPAGCSSLMEEYPEGTFYNIDVFNTLSDETKYKWWAGTDFLKCMIVRKTIEGFDFISERMIGIGFNSIWFPSDVEVKKSEWTWGDRTFESEYFYLKDFSLCNQYVKQLLSDKYSGVPFRIDINERKYNMLIGLRQKKGPIPISQSPYFNNQYFELRPDLYRYIYRGDAVTTQIISTSGNEYNQLYVSTVTTHYSIQERGDELKNMIIEIVISVFVLMVIVYGGFCAFKYKQQKRMNNENDK